MQGTWSRAPGLNRPSRPYEEQPLPYRGPAGSIEIGTEIWTSTEARAGTTHQGPRGHRLWPARMTALHIQHRRSSPRREDHQAQRLSTVRRVIIDEVQGNGWMLGVVPAGSAANFDALHLLDALLRSQKRWPSTARLLLWLTSEHHRVGTRAALSCSIQGNR
jgi:hypothetical protein